MLTRFGVVVPCHNDGALLKKSLPALVGALGEFEHRIIVIVDRSTDDTLEVVKELGADYLVKSETKWKNSTSENRNIGFLSARDSDYLAVVDADTLVTSSYFHSCIDGLRADKTRPSAGGALWSTSLPYRIYQAGLKSFGLQQGVRGTGRVYVGSVIRKCIDDDGYVFRDRIAEDSDFDLRLMKKGYGPRLMIPDAVMFDLRPYSFRKSVQGQLRLGRAYRELGKSFGTLGGEIVRGRLMVALGYLT